MRIINVEKTDEKLKKLEETKIEAHKMLPSKIYKV